MDGLTLLKVMFLSLSSKYLWGDYNLVLLFMLFYGRFTGARECPTSFWLVQLRFSSREIWRWCHFVPCISVYSFISILSMTESIKILVPFWPGGLKLWEGSLDLITVLRSDIINCLISFGGKRVLEVDFSFSSWLCLSVW